MKEKLYTRKELQSYFSVSIFTIDNWIKKGELKSYKIDNTVRISEGQLSEFLGNIKNNKDE